MLGHLPVGCLKKHSRTSANLDNIKRPETTRPRRSRYFLLEPRGYGSYSVSFGSCIIAECGRVCGVDVNPKRMKSVVGIAPKSFLLFKSEEHLSSCYATFGVCSPKCKKHVPTHSGRPSRKPQLFSIPLIGRRCRWFSETCRAESSILPG